MSGEGAPSPLFLRKSVRLVYTRYPKNRKIRRELGVEIGLTTMVITKATGVIVAGAEALGIMKAATIAAAGPWGALAIAIGLALEKLVKYNNEAIKKIDSVEYDEQTGETRYIQKADTGMGGLRNLNRASDADLANLRSDKAAAGNSYVGSSGAGAKTELERYLKNLSEYKDIWQRQIELYLVR